MSFDRAGEYGLFAIDAGEHLWEEISSIVNGGNYAWNVQEGTHCFDAANPTDPPEQCPDTIGPHHPDEGALLIDPVVEFANAKQPDGLGVTVTDGFLYRGTALLNLQGHLVFSMWSRSQAESQGRLFYAIPAATGLWQIGELTPGEPVAGSVGHFILGMGQDAAGELYIATSDERTPVGQTGRVYKLIPR
jgi:hypothetical protein